MNTSFRVKVLKIIPAMMILLGGLFVLSGLEGGIPLVSHKKEAMQVLHNNSEQHLERDHSICH